MKNLLSLFLIFFSFKALAVGRLDLSYGYFSLASKTEDASSNISNPTAGNIAYLLALGEKTQLNLGYTILLTDFSGSDKAYGVNVGLNYFILSSSKNEKFKDENIEVERFQLWKPYVGAGFYQREFQSIKNSYAGIGVNSGIEYYFNKQMSLKFEIRYVMLSGSSNSKATEINALTGIIFRI